MGIGLEIITQEMHIYQANVTHAKSTLVYEICPKDVSRRKSTFSGMFDVGENVMYI